MIAAVRRVGHQHIKIGDGSPVDRRVEIYLFSNLSVSSIDRTLDRELRPIERQSGVYDLKKSASKAERSSNNDPTLGVYC